MAIPTALRSLLIDVREGLKKKGDLGLHGGPSASVLVEMGWPEIRAVYALHTSLVKAKKSRDEWKKQANQTARVSTMALQATRSDFTELDRLNNHAVKSLLTDVYAILSGDDVPEEMIHATRERVKALIERKSVNPSSKQGRARR